MIFQSNSLPNTNTFEKLTRSECKCLQVLKFLKIDVKHTISTSFPK